ALGRFDRYREIRRAPLVRAVHHQRQAQLLAPLARQRQADQTSRVARHEIDVLRANLRRGHHEIALVLAILVVEDHDHLAAPHGVDDVLDAVEGRTVLGISCRHGSLGSSKRKAYLEKVRRAWPRAGSRIRATW